jgi:hypothetical protein
MQNKVIWNIDFWDQPASKFQLFHLEIGLIQIRNKLNNLQSIVLKKHGILVLTFLIQLNFTVNNI